MSQSYLKFGYVITWLLIAFAIPAVMLTLYLLIGHLAGFVTVGDWMTLQADGSYKIIIFGDSEASETLPVWVYTYMLMKGVITIGLWVYIIRLIQIVISSVDDLKTFQTENIVAFRRMGATFLALMVIGSFTIQGFNSFSLSLELAYLALAAGAFLISEVFKEGHNLYEQNRLMI